MAGAYFLSIASGFAVSSAFSLDRPAPQLCVIVPSMTACELRIEFGSSSGAGFGALVRPDGSGNFWSVHSGSGPATALIPLATPWARLSTTGTNQTGTRSFTLLVTRPYP